MNPQPDSEPSDIQHPESSSRNRTIAVSDIHANPAIRDPGKFINGGVTGELGFTAKFGLSPTTTLDFAYNPDFALVEADAPVVTANQRFPIFFQEKRPFFLEGKDIFNSPLQPLRFAERLRAHASS